MAKMLAFIMAFSFTAFASQVSFADIRSDISAGKAVGEVLRSAAGISPEPGKVTAVVRELVLSGADPEEVIRLCCNLGYDFDAAMAGAVQGGAQIDAVVKATLETSCMSQDGLPDALRRAGYAPRQIASSLVRAGSGSGGGDNYGYSTPGGSGGGNDTYITPGGGGGGGRYLSPNSY
jgi:hypothetical protein